MTHLVKCDECNEVFDTINPRQRFCSKKCRDKNLIRTRKEKRLRDNPPREIKCENCGKKFTTNRKNAMACSRKCISDLQNAKIREQRRIENEEKYKDIDDIPVCKICGWKARSIQQHVVQQHRMPLEEYKEKFNVTDEDIFHSSYIEFFSERVKGNKNPAYNHGGRLSPFSKKFKKYEELDDNETDEIINDLIEQANKTKDENGSYTCRLDYYLNQGMTEEEAKNALSERQTTFSLDICIEKYGEEKGKEIWEERQRKWLNSLDELSDEEKKRIYDAKVNALSNNYSKISFELFEKLGKKDAFYGENEIVIKTKNGNFKPDFMYGNKIIEFYGDFWHANPLKFDENEIMKYPSRINKNPMKASDIRKKDKFRNKELENAGFEILIVWEHDYKLDPEKEIQKCLEFINGNENEFIKNKTKDSRLVFE
jgi:G:T-mismatch repair DNA endonuclease (very short patch repair protein)/endogenous inhibitor of DNA gyrase (YacG/DUF329 family)